uniref:SET domain-containing protein n=1 Tax=Kalanchoe fedtschenkoi TaxID=63787 RepID=A0A7N0RGD5_KALFE
MLTAARKCRLALALNQAQKLPLFSSAASADASQQPSPPRAGPPPIQVSLTESAGRGVFATRRIGAGELIHTAKPFITHPSSSALDRVCYLCLRKMAIRANSAAGGSFCSEACTLQARAFYEIDRKANWEEFDEYCRINGLKYPYLAKRLACMVIAGVTSADSLNILQPENLSTNMISEMGKECSLLRNAFMSTDVKHEHLAFLNDEWYINVLARIRINAFRIELACGSYEDFLASAAASVEAGAAVGNAVYILPSFYNHDCDPNTHIVWVDNSDAKLKALRDIDQGEELRICYIDASMDHEARQRLLLGGFGFQCQCPRCLSRD